MIEEFKVDSKAEHDQLNLAHETKTKNASAQNKKNIVWVVMWITLISYITLLRSSADSVTCTVCVYARLCLESSVWYRLYTNVSSMLSVHWQAALPTAVYQ